MKICPFRTEGKIVHVKDPRLPVTGSHELGVECCQDKCALWVTIIGTPDTMAIGCCALAAIAMGTATTNYGSVEGKATEGEARLVEVDQEHARRLARDRVNRERREKGE